MSTCLSREKRIDWLAVLSLKEIKMKERGVKKGDKRYELIFCVGGVTTPYDLPVSRFDPVGKVSSLRINSKDVMLCS